MLIGNAIDSTFKGHIILLSILEILCSKKQSTVASATLPTLLEIPV